MGATDPPGGVRRIVVGYDGSDPAVRAVRFALQLVTQTPMDVWIVHASSRPPTVAEPRTEEEQVSEVDAIQASLRSIQESVSPEVHRVHVWVREGPPSEVLLRAAAEVDADLVVLGTRGLRGASRLLLGSVSGAVVVRSPRPVAVVP